MGNGGQWTRDRRDRAPAADELAGGTSSAGPANVPWSSHIAQERCPDAALKLARIESWCFHMDPREEFNCLQTESLLRETAAVAARVGRAETWAAMEQADRRIIWNAISGSAYQTTQACAGSPASASGHGK